jgi:predicted amidohydrolase YtcJ
MDTLTTRRDFLKAGAAGLACTAAGRAFAQERDDPADLILTNGRITTFDPQKPSASAVAIRGGRFVAVGDDRDVLAHRGGRTQVIDLKKRTVIPGLNDSHTHLIRGGLSYNLELRWDGVPSLADALRMLKEQAKRTPPPQWVRVVGGWSAFQFKERRMPTLDEINAAAPDTPVFVLHLYDWAWLNRSALRAVGYTKETPNPPGGEIQRDQQGRPTGLLIAQPNATILYATLAKGPKLSPADQINSTRLFMREMNRFGLTSCLDAGGGGQSYPEDYQVITDLAKRGELTVRIAYNLFTQRPKQEREDFVRWIKTAKPGESDPFYRLNGAGEMLVYSAADFEDFREPRPDLPGTMETELAEVVTLLTRNRWPFRLHATYDETITRALAVFEAVNQEVPFQGLRWFFDHAETISEKNLERVKALGGGIAVQHRMAYQGEYFRDRYGKQAAEHAPPVARMLKMGVPVGAGTDATRVASYNPWVCLYWLVTGKTVGGTLLYPEANRLDRTEALRRFTLGSAWFSGEENKKGAIAVGRLADLTVLSADYFSIPEEEIKRIEAVLTVVGGKVVYAAGDFAALAPPALPVSPDWSPVKVYSGYLNAAAPPPAPHRRVPRAERPACGPWWGLACDCFAL